MNLAADMMARPDCSSGHEETLSSLMIAVIERFAPWRSFPASIRELRATSGDWRIRRVVSEHAQQDRSAGGVNIGDHA